MENKFVLPAKKRRPSSNLRGEVVRIDLESYNLLVEMGNDSILPLGKIASKAIKYAYENLLLDKEEE